MILGAALRAFAAKGYDGASMDEIATGAGVSKAVVYDHVSSKRELYTLLLESIGRALIAVAVQALESMPDASEPRVHAATEAFFEYVEEHPAACRLLFIELQSPNVSDLGRELEDQMTATIAATLGSDPGLLAGIPRRERHLTILAELLKAATIGIASWWLDHPETPRKDIVERTVAVTWPAIERARQRDG
jgi:AcrR family transcriptional regulator